MACTESVGSKVLICFGLFVVASSFCHCSKLTRLKTSIKWKENSTLSRSQGSDLRHGRLLIGQDPLRNAKLKGTKALKNNMDADSGYQADMAWKVSRQPKGQGDGFSKVDNTAVEHLLKMEPKVECTGDSMKLQVQDAGSTPGSLFFVDRGSHLSPLPLSKLPSSCGYNIRSTRRDLVLVAPYDGCFVILEEDSYVLPLRWSGLPVRMSCPLMRQSSRNPPMVTCHAEGMVVKTEWSMSVDQIKVNLNGSWQPLMRESSRCGFSVVVHPEGVVISVRFAPCVKKKDGMYTIELAGDGETKISCPSLSPAQREPTKISTKGPKQQTETPGKGYSHDTLDQILKNPEQTLVSQVPGIPQNPEVLNEKLDQGPKDAVKPLFPYFYPNFFYPKKTDSELPVQPNPTPMAKKNGLQSQQTVPPAKLPVAPFSPLPFWPAQPYEHVKNEPTVLPPATQPPNSQVEQPFFPYPFYVRPDSDGATAHRPELKPTTTKSPPVTQGQRMQPFYHYPYLPLINTGTTHTQPPVIKHHLPNPSNPPSVPPVSKAPQGQIYNPIHSLLPYGPYQTPVPPTEQTLTTAPKGQAPPLGQLPPDTPSRLPSQESKEPVYPFPYYILPIQHEAHPGQAYPPFYHNPMFTLPQPENQPAIKPTAAPEPTKPPMPEDPQPKPENKPALEPTKPPTPEVPQRQMYPLFYPQPKPENKPALEPTKPPTPEAPQRQMYHLFYPQPKPENKPALEPTKPPMPEAPQRQMYHLFYPQPKPENKPALEPTKPPTPEAPQRQMYQLFYPQPKPENKPASEPTKPPTPEAPQGQVHLPFHLHPFYGMSGPEYQLTTKPTPVTKSSATEIPKGQVHLLVTLPPASYNQQQPIQQSNIQQPSHVGAVPQVPQLGTPSRPPVYCPHFCPPGLSNCCPQIAFHQHLHHIVPAGLGSNDKPPIYPVLPNLPSMAYSVFGNGLMTAPLPQQPNGETPISSQSPPFENAS
ncbi:titin-like isoform X3 [Scomber scombrus]|uniref:Titin-like isoform X3 n=1 Tax=Scomber scombrus TaxID=13677 RepID=A0AAV1MZD2_SCOSC